MTKDEIIRMAREAGLPSSELYHGNLERFAALVAAASASVEREVCAKVAEAYEPRCDTCPSGVANAIRAMGNT